MEKDNESAYSSEEIGDLGWRERSSKIWRKDQ